MKATIFKTTFDIPCDIYGCNTRAVYAIGNKEGPPNMYVNVCKKCMDAIVRSSPQELLPENEDQKKEIEAYQEQLDDRENEIKQLETKLEGQGAAVKELTKLLDEKKEGKK